MNVTVQITRGLYDITDSEYKEVGDLMMEIVVPVAVEIQQKFGGRKPDNLILNEILVCVKEKLFDDMPTKIVLRVPQGERKDAGSILKYLKIKVDTKEIPFYDYIFYLAAFKLDKAFTKIK
jgi:hypothetical protein